MEHPLRFAPSSEVKSAIAHAWLAQSATASAPSLGAVTLRPHQQDAVARVRRLLDRNRVALLADDVGLGKTYVAIAVAAEARAPLVVAPAALRDMWRDALRAADVTARWMSYEQLSRGTAPAIERPDLIILDEAHHARVPSTRRSARLSALAAGAKLLLLSATPIHNRREDLTALFALALGRPARSLDDDAIAALTVRRTHDDVPAERLPALVTREWIRVPDDEHLLQRLLALPPPLPPRDGGDGGVLLGWTLVRLWASTRGALKAALRRRLQRGWALRHALASGVLPTRAELAAWQCSDQAVQLAFPELMASPSANSQELERALDRHLEGLEELLTYLTSSPNPDRDRAAALRALRRESPGERILVFTQFAASAAALWRLLRADDGVAVLTSKGAEVAGGTIARREALRRFAPRALGASAPARAERIELLISTDLLSEGVNLQDASVVVHLDLPWTHARLAQRVGRVRRMGSEHASVRVLTFAPPAPAERLLEVERRIAAKLGAAARTLGIAGTILPSLVEHAAGDESPARAAEQLRGLLTRWQRVAHSRAAGECVVAMVRGQSAGTLAALTDPSGRVAIVATRSGATADDPRTVLGVATALEALLPAAPDERAARRECRRLERWAEARSADRTVAGAISIEGASRRATLRRLAAIVARTPIARREETASLAAEARRIAGSAIGTGGELILGQLVAAPMPDDAWLRAIAAFAGAHRHCAVDSRADGRHRAVALIMSIAADH